MTSRPSSSERSPSLRSSTLAVVLVRAGAAGLHLAFAVPAVALLGPTDAGRILATVSAIELASLIGRLGLPVDLARRRRLGGPMSTLPTGPAVTAAMASALLAAVIAAVVDLSPVPLIIGAVAVTTGQVAGGWQRGAGHFLLASLAHPVPALATAVAGLVIGAGHPVWWYVAGASTAAAVQLWRAGVDLAWTPIGRPALLHLVGTASLGIAGLANQALLLALPVVLVAQGHAVTATVLSLAIGAYRPVVILQAGVNFTVGPIVAAAAGVALRPEQRRLLDRASGIQQVAFVCYVPLAGVAVAIVGAGVGVGHDLPTLLPSWLVLLAGHAVAIGTGPTGQLLLMRGNQRSTIVAGACGIALAVAFLALPVPPWLRASGAVSTSLLVQNVLTARGVWHHDRWLARPRSVWPVGLSSVIDLALSRSPLTGGRRPWPPLP